MIVLRSVRLRPQGHAPMKRKTRGSEVAGMVYACLLCGWESAPISGPPRFAQVDREHQCFEQCFDGAQSAFNGPRFTRRERT